MARRNLVKAVVDLEDRLSRKLGTVGRSVRTFVGDMNKGSAQTSRWGTELSKWGSKVHNYFGSKTKALVRGWFMSMKISAAIGFAAIQVGIYKAFQKFTELDATIRNTTGLLAGAGASSAEADKAYKTFTDDVLRLAPAMGKAPQDLAESLYDIVSGGFAGAEATKVLETSAKGAKAGMTDTAVVANALVKSLQAYGYEADQASTLADQMFQSVNVGIISFEEMAQNLGDVVGLASTAKVSFSDLMAAIAQMTLKGMVPAEAFTSLNQVMLAILSPGTAEAEAAGEIFGKDVEDKWSAQAVAAKGLGGVMEGLMEKLDPSKDQIDRLNSMNNEVADMAAAEIAGDKIDTLTSLFGNVRALRGALILASGGSYSFADAQADMADSVGATDRVISEQEKTVQASLNKIKAQWDVFQIEVMQGIAPTINTKVEELTGWLSGVMSSEDYVDAEGFGKVKVLWDNAWSWMSTWWEDNKAPISAKMEEGIEWLGDTALPWITDVAVSLGTELGVAMVPAIWDGLLATAPGKAIVGAIALSWANKLGAGIATSGTAGGAGAGGAGGGAAAGGLMSGKFGSIVASSLAISGAVLMTKAAIDQASVSGIEVATAEADLETTIQNATTAGLRAGLKEAEDGGSFWENGAEKFWALHPDNKTSAEHINAELAEREKADYTVQIQGMQDTGMIEALERAWKDTSLLGEDGQKALEEFASAGPAAGGATALDPTLKTSSSARVDMSGQGDFSKLIDKYLKDPASLEDGQRQALEAFLSASGGTTDKIRDMAQEMLDLGFSGEAFTDIMLSQNPILEGMGDISIEWGMRLVDTVDKMDQGMRELANAQATAEDLLAWAQAGGWRNSGAAGRRSDERQAEIREGKGRVATPDAFERALNGEGRAEVHQNALGSHGTVSKPTLFMAGEAGAEDFAFTPHLKGGILGGNDQQMQRARYSEPQTLQKTDQLDPRMAEFMARARSGGQQQQPTPMQLILQSPLVGEVKVAPDGKSVEEVADELAELLLAAVNNGAGSD